MNKYIAKISLLALSLTVVVSSCEFGDTNVDPALPTDVSVSALLPSGETAVSWVVGGEIVRFSGLLTQQFRGIGSTQQEDNWRYLIRDADTDGMWQRMYHNSLNTVNTVIEKAEEQNTPHYQGIAEVLMATGVGNFTDAFGSIPYSTAFEGDEGNFTPSYDEQEALYTTTLPQLLDEAIANLSADESPGGSPGNDDLIFDGNLELWIKAANSLRLRYTFQQGKRNPAAYEEALALIPSAISSNAEDYEMTFGTSATEPNPQYQFTQRRSGNMRMDDYFVSTFSENDTRRPFLVDGENGFEFSGYYTSINSPVVLMSYVEVKFIEAEAHLAKATPDVAAAKVALDEAIMASFLKITSAPVPEAYQAELDANWAAATDKLEVLINEKYIACYSQSLISWNDYRRTGYPELETVPNGVNAFNSNGEVPRRLPYPQEERLLNPNNIPTSTPNLQDRFWWDQ
ncbi:SusD/RagB family nutrient-binding outer membrane lipoprotein [Tunicatimonas pelagia]|uniref:SusD/RagB family nutrient-binding outer membrane lipoprotein n=1 Tax=Tunicatimonas pelagia TaxID=931531 RepID=UPI0026669BBD|nr:SusD/RagB family nutrient-binding outer membrane lipoprotein [Tunicatimonas pelagia]WKN43172.1 SusD/RagB family nutrient-binding outer membrane lipoprotein [Tunicatimonas pelagia]